MDDDEDPDRNALTDLPAVSATPSSAVSLTILEKRSREQETEQDKQHLDDCVNKQVDFSLTLSLR